MVNPKRENYHLDVEQAAFSPGRLVPGIEPSPDPLLQWRLVFYHDAQVYRRGVIIIRSANTSVVRPDASSMFHR